MVGEFSHTAARGQTLRMEPKHLLEGPTALHCDYQPQQQNPKNSNGKKDPVALWLILWVYPHG
jgi:hypothetical protein